MSYALTTLWHERQRFLPGILAVAFSALLIALQCGLLLGLFSITSIPIDMSNADIWVGHPEVPSVDLGRPIPESWMSYLAMPEVDRIEPFMEGFAYWDKPTGGMELCVVIGSRLGPQALGAIKQLTPEHRTALTELGSVVVDRGEFGRLGLSKVGDYAEVAGRRVRVVGTVTGLKSLAGPYIFCSIETSQMLLRPPQEQVTFLLAKLRHKGEAKEVVERLEAYPKKIAAFTAEDFSLRSRLHWLLKTKAGVALGLAALLGLLVGAVVTSQTLYAATVSQLKEYAVLRAMGIPRWRMALSVLAQSFWVGIAGVAIALPMIFGLAEVGNEVGAKILLPIQLLAGAVVVTMTMAMLSGLWALRSLRLVEPVNLLR
ncbi:MAG: ABC transporter permease [Gemmataceae bacterium]